MRLTALVAAALLALAGCSAPSGGEAAVPAASPTVDLQLQSGSPGTAAGAPAGSGAAGSTGVPGSATPTRRARSLNGALTVRVAPAPGARVVATLPATTALGSARVLMALGGQGDWVRVALPIRPNGTTGWVRKADVAVDDVRDRIVVGLSARTMVLQVGGVPAWSTPIAIGAPATPTPTGTFFVVDRVRTTDPAGTYGPFALGLSAHSPTLTEFGDGDAQVGIHGTDQPASIGTATTHGCLRVSNAMALALRGVPLGTPVAIVD